MSTVAEVTDRVFRDWLVPANDRGVVVAFASAVDDETDTWTYDDSTLAQDEDVLAPGVVVEAADGEQAQVTDVDVAATTLTVRRGHNGTTPAAHAAGDAITVAPLFGRRAALEAVKDTVVSLYPSLWQVATTEVTTAYEFIEVPAEVVTPIKFVWQNGVRYQQATVSLLTNFPPSSTEKAITLFGVPPGHTAYFTYRGRFARPDSDDAELSDLGVLPEHERIVSVGAASQVVGGGDAAKLSTEYITELLARESQPAETTRSVRDGLLRLFLVWLDQASSNLKAEQPVPVLYESFTAGLRS